MTLHIVEFPYLNEPKINDVVLANQTLLCVEFLRPYSI